jgi:hypothetical protein
MHLAWYFFDAAARVKNAGLSAEVFPPADADPYGKLWENRKEWFAQRPRDGGDVNPNHKINLLKSSSFVTSSNRSFT